MPIQFRYFRKYFSCLLSEISVIALIFVIMGTTFPNQAYTSNSFNYESNTPFLNKENSLVVYTNVNDFGLNYSTFFGGNGQDMISGMKMDNSRNLYIVGTTNSTDLPVKNAYDASFNGVQDVFIAKFLPNGDLSFSTYFGSSGLDNASTLALDQDGNIYIAGETSSIDFPTFIPFETYNGSTDAFVAKFTTNGELVFSSYLGGDSLDIARAITTDNLGNCYITGLTNSSNFPTTIDNPHFESNDAFITKISTDGSLVFSTVIGGSENDYGSSIYVNDQGESFITGSTQSEDFPTSGDAFNTILLGPIDGFFSKFNSSGGLVYSSMLVGSPEIPTYATNILGDKNNNIFIAGNRNAHIFISSFNSNYYLVGEKKIVTNESSVSDFAFDIHENPIITGKTMAPDYLTLNSSTQIVPGNGSNVFVTKFNSSVQITFSTVFGGSNDDESTGVAVDSEGVVYVTGTTFSENFPVTTGTTFTGSSEGFISRFSTFYGISNTTNTIQSNGTLFSPTTGFNPISETTIWSIMIPLFVVVSFTIVEYRNFLKMSKRNKNKLNFYDYLKKRHYFKKEKRKNLNILSEDTFKLIEEIENELKEEN